MSPTPRANPAAFERRSGQAGKVTSTQADLLAAAAYIDPPGGDNEVGVLDSQEARRLAAMLRHVAASPAISPDEASVQGWLAALSDALLASKGNDWLHEKTLLLERVERQVGGHHLGDAGDRALFERVQIVHVCPPCAGFAARDNQSGLAHRGR